MPNIDLTEVMHKANDDEFWAVRGKAVQAYAALEQALCRIFAQLSGTNDAVAALFFSKLRALKRVTPSLKSFSKEN